MKYSKLEAEKKMNALGKAKLPFLFIIDFEMTKIQIIEENEFDQEIMNFHIDGIREVELDQSLKSEAITGIDPIVFKKYKEGYDIVQSNINHGNSYLLNLTYQSSIETSCDLIEIFNISRAKYKLYWKDKFVVFSPETFIKIMNDCVYSYPMKGTIDASEMDALNHLLNDEKEIAEHYTIVDLIRNDLGRISKNVRVTNFRYVEKIQSNDRELFQTSSEIMGDLSPEWRKQLGTIFFNLLPAGSISGAPKTKTVEIIQEAENGPRGYYTGVFGYYNGNELDSGVMIRFIEKQKDKFYYRSGGGITSRSDLKAEYKELIQKIYVPIIRSN